MAKPYKLLTIVASEYGKYASLETVVSIERIDSKLYYNLGKLQGLEYNAVQFVLSRP